MRKGNETAMPAKSKHTMYKWRVNSASRMEVNSFKGIAIADCSISQMINTEEKEANARLIAAAPELLEALQKLIERGEIMSDTTPLKELINKATI